MDSPTSPGVRVPPRRVVPTVRRASPPPHRCAVCRAPAHYHCAASGTPPDARCPHWLCRRHRVRSLGPHMLDYCPWHKKRYTWNSKRASRY